MEVVKEVIREVLVDRIVEVVVEKWRDYPWMGTPESHPNANPNVNASFLENSASLIGSLLVQVCV